MINNFKDNDMDFIPKENVDYYISISGNKYYYQSYIDKLNKVRKKIDKECDRVIKATINKNKKIDELEQITDKQQKEIERLNKALEDIQTILIKKQKVKGLTNQLLNVQEERCLDIVNKAFGSDKE